MTAASPVADLAPALLSTAFGRLIAAHPLDVLHDQPERFTRYIVRRREAVRAYQTDVPALAILSSGHKEIGLSGRSVARGPGTMTLIPANTALDVVNEPDARTGVYAAALILFPLPLLQRVRLLHPTAFAPIGLDSLDPRRWDVPATPLLQEAVARVLDAVSAPDAVPAEILDHRVMEIALLLADKPLLPARGLLRDGQTGAAVTSLLSGDLSRPWTAAHLASLIGMSEATLRRRLAEEDLGLRKLLTGLRREQAARLQAEGVSAADAAAAVGLARGAAPTPAQGATAP